MERKAYIKIDITSSKIMFSVVDISEIKPVNIIKMFHQYTQKSSIFVIYSNETSILINQQNQLEFFKLRFN
jgi:hypothetical protein